MRTTKLDRHWEDCRPDGAWYCYTCKFYTGQLEHHADHRTVKIVPSREGAMLEAAHERIRELEQQLVERNREIKNLKDVIAAPEKPRYAQLLEQICEVEQQLKTAQDRIRELAQEPIE